MKSIRVATCQFSVEGRIDHNRKWMLKQIAQAAELNPITEIARFCAVDPAGRFR